MKIANMKILNVKVFSLFPAKFIRFITGIWRTIARILKIRYSGNEFLIKSKWTIEPAELLPLQFVSSDIEERLMQMMIDELNIYRVQKDLEYIERHKVEYARNS